MSHLDLKLSERCNIPKIFSYVFHSVLPEGILQLLAESATTREKIPVPRRDVLPGRNDIVKIVLLSARCGLNMNSFS